MIIENNFLRVTCKPEGAELTSIFHKQHDLEYLWQAGIAWMKHAPVLFPIVGELKNKRYFYNDNEYKMERHGFARNMVFMIHEQSDEHITYRLVADENTQQAYPILFTFDIKYSIDKETLAVDYIIHNPDKKDLLFSVGAHPAFKIPLTDREAYDDYYLEFEREETANRWLLQNGLIDKAAESFFNKTKTLPLQKKLFYDDALVFKNLASTVISIKNKNNAHGLHFRFEGFPYFGIWAAKDADFVCLEPWHGIADSVNSDEQLENKEGIIRLATDKTFKCRYSISCF